MLGRDCPATYYKCYRGCKPGEDCKLDAETYEQQTTPLVQQVQLTAIEDDMPEPEWDFTYPEDVLIEVIDLEEPNHVERAWGTLRIESCVVLTGPNAKGRYGAASYDKEYGGFLDYTLMGIVDKPSAPGWYVVVGVTGVYTKGDGWTTDDDFELYHKELRPATAEEIALG